MKPKPGDISIVDNTGTFLMWYDKTRFFGLTADTFLAYASRNSGMKPVSWAYGGRGADPGRESSYEI